MTRQIYIYIYTNLLTKFLKLQTKFFPRTVKKVVSHLQKAGFS